MNRPAAPHLRQQERVNAYFHAESDYWADIYASGDVQGEIYRARQTAALDWINSLALAPGARVLEVGCGAGFMTIALARRGFQVHAIDAAEAMVEQAHRHVAKAGLDRRVTLGGGDIYALACEDRTFDLVVALGVIPWLERPELAMREMARVTRPGGYVILSADNRARLNHLFDPWLHPALAPLKRRVKAAIGRTGLRRLPDEIGATFHTCRFTDAALTRAGFVKARGMTLGFGPFSLFRRKIVPEPLATKVHHRLQRLADRNMPGFRSTGAHYLVLAGKPMPPPSRAGDRAE